MSITAFPITTTTIAALSSLSSGTVDRANDVLEITDVSASSSLKITPNALMGISGSALGTTDTQNVSNKTFDNTNTFTAKDTTFTLQDDGDATKQVKFQLSGITTGQTRTFTFPDASDTIVVLAAAQTLTNKTLTSPTITGGTIDNSTVTVDAVSGHTTSNTGTVYGVAITGGTLGTTALAANAVQANQLATNAISLGYTQITTNFTTTNTTPTQVTSLSATVTIPAGGRRVKITAYCSSVYTASSTIGAIMGIWDGTVGSGTRLNAGNGFGNSSGGEATTTLTVFAVVTPAAGSKTYNVGLQALTATTATMEASSTNPAFILVEAI